MTLPVFKSVQEAMEYMQKRNTPQELARFVLNNVLPENPREELLKYMYSLLKTTKIPEDVQYELIEKIDRRIKKKLKGINNDRKKLKIMAELVPYCIGLVNAERAKYEAADYKAAVNQIKIGCLEVIEKSDLTDEEKEQRKDKMDENFSIITDENQMLSIDEIRYIIDGVCEIGIMQREDGSTGLSLFIPSKEQREQKKETVTLRPEQIMSADEILLKDENFIKDVKVDEQNSAK